MNACCWNKNCSKLIDISELNRRKAIRKVHAPISELYLFTIIGLD